MAKDTNRILDETVGAFKRLKEEVKGYKDELASLKTGSEEWNKTARKLADAQKSLDAINKAAKGNLAAYDKEQQNSINGLKERIKLLNQERNAMDMSSKEYKKATKELNELNDKLREARVEGGDWTANVGRYGQAISGAFEELGTAATGLTGNIGILNASLLKMASNPVGATIVAVAAGAKFLAEGIKSSEENTNKWNEAMVPLKTVLVMIQREAQKAAEKFTEWVKSLRENETAINLVQGALKVLVTMFESVKVSLSNVKEALNTVKEGFKSAFEKTKDWISDTDGKLGPLKTKIGEVGSAIKDKIHKAITDLVGLNDKIANSWIGKLLGFKTSQQIEAIGEKSEEVTEQITEDFKETEQAVTKTTKAANALAATLRGLGHQAAQLNGEIEELQANYAEALEEKDYEKAQQILNELTEKRNQLAQVQVNIAGAQLNVIREQNKLAGSSTANLNAEAQAMDAVTAATYGFSRATRENAQEQKKLNKLIDAQAKQKEADETKKRLDAYKESIAALNQSLNDLDGTYSATVARLKTPLKPEGGEIDTFSIDAYYDALNENARAEYEAYKEMVEAKIALLEEFIEKEKAAGNDTLQYETQLAKLRKEQTEGYAKQYEEMVEKCNKSDKDRAKMQAALHKTELQTYAALFEGVSDMFEQNTVAYKATATAKALINTYLAATSALAETPGGPIIKGVAMAATLASGLAQVIQIWKTNPKGETSVPSTTTPAVAEPSLQETNPYTYTRSVQTVQEEDRLNQPMYVSVTDINNVQNRVKVTETESTW